MFKAALTLESITPLLEFISSTEDEPVEIFFSSEGGENDVSMFLLSVLNKNSHRITLTAGEWIWSNGFNIFMRFKGAKQLSPSRTVGILHFSSVTLNSISLLDENTWDSFSKRELDVYNEQKIEMYSSILSGEEKLKLKKGEDVYFSHNRLQEILNEGIQF